MTDSKKKTVRRKSSPPLQKPVLGEALRFAEAPSAEPAMAEFVTQPAPDAERPSQQAPAEQASTRKVLARDLLPQDPALLHILKMRAQALAQTAETASQEQTGQFLRLRLGASEWYGVPYEHLEEIIYANNIARVPCTPAFVAGVVNRHGELLPVLDLQQLFRSQSAERDEQARIVVVLSHGVRTGLLVDAVEGNETYDPAALAAPIASDGVSNIDHVQGIYQGKVTLLNIAALLADPALTVNQASQ